MINLDEIKLVLIDFDDTLAIHTDFSEWEDYFDSNLTETYDCFERGKYMQPLPGMLEFLRLIHERDIATYCVTWISYSTSLKGKLKFIEENYFEGAVWQIVGCAKKLGKVKFAKEYCKANGIKLNQVLLIDDRDDVRKAAKKAGIQAIQPQYISAVYGICREVVKW